MPVPPQIRTDPGPCGMDRRMRRRESAKNIVVVEQHRGDTLIGMKWDVANGHGKIAEFLHIGLGCGNDSHSSDTIICEAFIRFAVRALVPLTAK